METLQSLSGRVAALGVPMVDAGTAEGALNERGVPWYFRVAPTDRALVRAAFGLIRQERATGIPVRRVTVVETSESDAVAGALREVAGAAGNDVTSVRYRGLPTEIDTVYQQVLAAGADVVFLAVGSDAEAAVAAQLGQRLRDKVPVIALGPGVGAIGSAGAGAGLLRSVGWSAEYARKNPAARAVADLYMSRFGAPLTEVAAIAFTATLTLASAVDGARTVSGEAVRSALRGIWFPGAQMIMPWDGIRFDASGRNELAAGLVDQRAGSGFQVVYPAELSSAKVAWPAAGKPLALP